MKCKNCKYMFRTLDNIEKSDSSKEIKYATCTSTLPPFVQQPKEGYVVRVDDVGDNGCDLGVSRGT